MESRDNAIHIGDGISASDGAHQELGKQPRQWLIAKALAQVGVFFKTLWKLGRDDFRRVIHGLKVGLAMGLVTLLTILHSTSKAIGKNAIWAVLTVIVVCEFTAGATLSKGLNRGLGTVVAALIALGVSHLSLLGGELVESLIVGFSVFIIGAGATYSRFIPKIKAKFDYGVVVFLLTFSMILVTAYQDVDSLRTSLERLLTICIGCGIAVVVSVLVWPIWAGEDLHFLIVGNLDKLSLALQECVNNYVSEDHLKEFQLSKVIMGGSDGDPVYNQYKGVLQSNATEESLANFAAWEPPHGQFKLRYPWKKYLKVGAAIRHCAYGIVALHSCLHSDAQAPFLLRQSFREELLEVATEAASVLQELSLSVRTMRTRGSNARNNLHSAQKAAQSLNRIVNSRTRLFFSYNPASSLQPNRLPLVKVLQPSSADATAVAHPQEEANSPEGNLPGEDCGGREDARKKWPKLLPHCLSSPLPSCGGTHPAAALNDDGRSEAEVSRALLSVATFGSLLVEVVARLVAVVDAVEVLAKAAHYKESVEADSEEEGDQMRHTNILGRELSFREPTAG